MRYIKSRSQEIDIPCDNPFANDKLDRGVLCNVLTDMVSFYGQSGCVMALCGEWGSGKTTFVKMWKQRLENGGYKTLYFNAWSSDYTTDPLMALVSELSELSPNNDTINKIATSAVRIGVSALKGVVKKATGIDCDALSNAIDETFEIGEEYLKEYSEQKTKLEEFKNDVQKYVAENAAEHPVVFFIDELDRCNPHYAVAVLERIKHLFEIPNIIFVLAINKKELSNAIQGFYGSSKIDSDEYLRRFIDINYELPKPKIENYCEFLFEEYRFNEFFSSDHRSAYFSRLNEVKEFKTIALNICEGLSINLRLVDRIFAYSRLALMQFNSDTYVMPGIYFMLCLWKVTDSMFYNQLKNKEFTIQEVLSKLEEKLPKSMLNDNNNYNSNILVIANFIYCYDISTTGYKKQKPTLTIKKTNSTIECEPPIQSKYIDNNVLLNALEHYYSNGHFDLPSLWHIFNRIDLLNHFY